MDSIKVLDFAKNVENNRQRLIDATGSLKTDSLDTVVTNAVNKLNDYYPDEETRNEVRFFDVKGNQIGDSFWVEDGGSVVPPDDNNPDPEQLTFLRWASAIGPVFENIKHDVDYMPLYTINDKGWHLLCSFDELTGLNPSIHFYACYADNNVRVSWGDGIVENFTSSTQYTFEHTYDDYGDYEIAITVSNYHINCYIQTTSSQTLLGSSDLDKALRGCYMYTMYDYNLYDTIYNEYTVVEGSVNRISAATQCYYYGNVVISNRISPWHFYDVKRRIVDGLDLPGSTQYSLPNIGTFLDKCILPSWQWSGIQSRTSLSGCNKFILLSDINAPTEIVTSANAEIVELYNINRLPRYTESSSFRKTKKIKIDTSKLTYIEQYAIPPILTSIVLPKSIQTCNIDSFLQASDIRDIVFPQDWKFSLNLHHCANLSKNSIIDLAIKAKDLSSTTASTLKFQPTLERELQTTYVSQVNGVYEECSKNDQGAISLLMLLTDKNWTVSFEVGVS